MLAYLKHMWAGGARHDAFRRLQDLVGEIASSAQAGTAQPFVKPDVTALSAAAAGLLGGAAAKRWGERLKPSLGARSYLRLAIWQWALDDGLEAGTQAAVLGLLRRATEVGGNWSKAWHHWALFNVALMDAAARRGEAGAAAAVRHVAPAITGFFRSVALGQVGAGGSAGGGGMAAGCWLMLVVVVAAGRVPACLRVALHVQPNAVNT